MEFGEDPATLTKEMRVVDKTESWITEYEKIKKLRPEIKIDKKTKQLKVTGLNKLNG